MFSKNWRDLMIFQPHFGLKEPNLMNPAGDGRLPSTLGPTSCGLQARWPGLERVREWRWFSMTYHENGWFQWKNCGVFWMQHLQTMDGFNWWITETLGATWFCCDAPWRISMILHCKPRSKQAQRLVTYNACETSRKSFGGGTEAVDRWSPRRDVSYLNI